MRRGLMAVLLVWGCGDSTRLRPVEAVEEPEVPAPTWTPPDAGPGLVELVPQDAGALVVDAGAPDAGAPDAGAVLPPAERGTVAAGALFTCALAGGDVYCWGKNEVGQLGNFNGTASPLPVKVPSVSGAVEVSAGHDHACALTGAGRVWCWGANDLGQLGRGSTTARELPAQVPAILDARAVSAGSQGITCALSRSGQVWCWGRSLGSNGNGGSGVPTLVPGLSGVHSISVGDHHICALFPSGAVQCWGGNYAGALGDGTKVDRLTPAPVPGLPPAMQVAAGNGYTCAVDAASGVWCWGRGESGQVGVSTQPEVLTARQATGVTGAQVIVSQGLHTCVRAATGALSCFGSNAIGQLGTGAQSANPELLPLATGITDAVGASAGTFHTCARRAGGGVECWGINSDGQLGNGASGTLSMSAVAVIGLP